MATRILAAYYLTKQDDEFPATNFDAFLRNSSFNQHVVVTDSDHQQCVGSRTLLCQFRGLTWNSFRIAYDIAVASTILLKNVDNALPLKKPKTLAMIGSDCEPPPYGPNFYSDRGGDSGTLAMGWCVLSPPGSLFASTDSWYQGFWHVRFSIFDLAIGGYSRARAQGSY
jgi:beta-glucosidase